MSNAKARVTAAAVAILLLVSTVCSQGQNPASGPRSNTTVTAAATGDRVRFTAPATVVQMRLEVYNANGEKAFDNEVRGGNVIDWHLHDGKAEQLSDGSYLCVVTTKSLAGRMSQKLGRVMIQNTTALMQPIDPNELTAQETQAVGPFEENASLTVMKEGESQTGTVIAHDGTDGQITRGRGALSFRLGDFFSGKDSEQMKLTEEGNLGIGTSNPKVKLDVAGMIGARDGLMFSDGSTLSVNRKGVLTHTTSKGDVVPGASGTGTQNQLAKWTDNSGTLGDSAVVDVSGAIGIGTTNPQTGLDYHNAQAPFFTRDFPTNPGNAVAGLQLGLSNVGSRNVNVGPSFLFFSENTAGAKSFLGRVSGIWENPTAGSEAGSIFFQVRANSADVNALTERMRIKSNGNVGIGTQGPLSKLHITSGASDLPPRLQSAGSANFGTSFAAGWDFYHGTIGKGYVGVPDASAGFGAGELILFGGPGTPTSLWSNSNRTMTLDTAGNVGIGTTAPAHRLSLIGGPPWTSNLFTGALELGNAAAIGWQADPGGQRFGIAPATGGLYFFHTTSNPGTTGSPANFDFEIGDGGELHAYGNAQQARNKGGWVKAMLRVAANGAIISCFNSFLSGPGADTSPCGFTVNRFTPGGYGIDLGFRVDDRFVSVTAEYAFSNCGSCGNPKNIGANYSFIAANTSSTVDVFTFFANEPNSAADNAFMIFIY